MQNSQEEMTTGKWQWWLGWREIQADEKTKKKKSVHFGQLSKRVLIEGDRTSASNKDNLLNLFAPSLTSPFFH